MVGVTSSDGGIAGQVRHSHPGSPVGVTPNVRHAWQQAEQLLGCAWPPATPPATTVTEPAASPHCLAKQRGCLGPEWVREARDAGPQKRDTCPAPQMALSSIKVGRGEKIGTKFEAGLAQRDPAPQRGPQQAEAGSVRERVRSVFVAEVGGG